MGIKVRALERGNFVGPVDPGQIFEIADESQLGSWMEPVEPKDLERLQPKLDELRIKKRRAVRKPPPGMNVPPTPVQLRDPIVPKPAETAPAGAAPAPPPAPAGAPQGRARQV
jgi:hypothetical protein